MFHRTHVALVLLVVAAGVTSAADSSDAERLSASHAKWQQVKKACGGNYSYQVIQSSFTGYRSETHVLVKDNAVVERRFVTVTPPQPGQPPAIKTEWVETGKEVGTHKQGAEPRTLDELYAVAKKLVEAAPPANHVRQVAFDKQGLLQYCFLRDTRIQDDVPLTGVAPIALTLGKQ